MAVASFYILQPVTYETPARKTGVKPAPTGDSEGATDEKVNL